MSRQRPLTVLLATEGTYPFYTGGVSKWCDLLTHGLPEIEFQVQAVVTNPYPESKYELAPQRAGSDQGAAMGFSAACGIFASPGDFRGASQHVGHDAGSDRGPFQTDF